MKNLFTGFCGLALIGLAACTDLEPTKEIKGYPVYKFLNFGAINAKELKANEAATQKFLGKGYDNYVRIHELFVSRGFDLYTPLMIHTASSEDVEVYIRREDYDFLWKTSPHDLAKQRKSHFVTVNYVPVRVGQEPVNRAVSFQATLIDHDPIICK